MFCIYIKEAAAKQELNRSRSLKFSLQQEQELEPESIFQEQDWIRSQKFWTPITSALELLSSEKLLDKVGDYPQFQSFLERIRKLFLENNLRSGTTPNVLNFKQSNFEVQKISVGINFSDKRAPKFWRLRKSNFLIVCSKISTFHPKIYISINCIEFEKLSSFV